MPRAKGARKPRVAKPKTTRTFEVAPEVKEVAQTLIKRHSWGIKDAHIEYYWRTRMADSVLAPVNAQDHRARGKVSAAGARDQKTLKRDFIVEINRNWGEAAGPGALEAELFHLLSRCVFTDRRPRVLRPDIQVMTREFELYGAWSPELKAMAQATLPLEVPDATDDAS